MEASQGRGAGVRLLKTRWLVLAVVLAATEWILLSLAGFGLIPHFDPWRMQRMSEIAVTGLVWGVCIFIVIDARHRKRE